MASSEIKRCSNCIHAASFVPSAEGGFINTDAHDVQLLQTSKIVAQTNRDCFSYVQLLFSHPVTILLPGDDDRCVNESQFKSRPA